MEFLQKDNVIYDELEDVSTAGTELKGDGKKVQEVFGFLAKKSEAASEEVTLIYRCRQVLATKVTGSGKAFKAGDRVFYIVASKKVDNAPTGTPGTNSYFCGWAKRDAAALDTTVLINFDGTRCNETLAAS